MAEIGKQRGEKGELPGAALSGRSRRNPGDWIPFVDWRDVFPGNRGVNRHAIYDLYDAPIGIKLDIEQSLESDPLLVADEVPWEIGASMQPGGGALKHEGRYYLFYSGDGRTCVAVSDDGYHFTRPNLGQVEFNGSRDNNILANGPRGGVFLDPKAPPEERFKSMGQECVYFDPDTGKQLTNQEGEARNKARDLGGPDYKGLRVESRHWVVAWVSPDLLHWKRIEKPVADFPSDGGNHPQYDAETDTYFDYIRVHGLEPPEPKGIGAGVPELGVGRRTIGLTRTKDYWNWPPPKLVIYPTPQDPPDTSFYGANYFRYPGRTDLHGLFLEVYHQVIDQIDNQVAFSRDGLIWYRHHKAIIPRGPVGSGYEGMNRTYGGGLVELPDGYWATTHECNSSLHNRGGFRHHGVDMDLRDAITGEKLQPTQIRWARWQPHRLCGIEAEVEGRFTIPTIPRTKSELRLNYRCQSGGFITVELIPLVPSRLNPDLEGIPGFTFEECDRLTGDSLDQVVTWKDRSNISSIGETVAIRVKMFQAKLFAYLV